MAFDLITGAMMASPWGYPQIVGQQHILGQDPSMAALMRAASAGMMHRDELQQPRFGVAGMEVPPEQIQAAMAQRLAQLGLITQTSAPTKAREYPLGFDSGSTLIIAGGSASVINRPQVVFRTERLVVPSDIGGGFVIDDLIVGKNSQFASNSVAVPARVFDERGVGVRLAGDTAQISQDIILKVTNVSGAPARFRAAVIGPAVE
jgi:hypothetical protein